LNVSVPWIGKTTIRVLAEPDGKSALARPERVWNGDVSFDESTVQVQTVGEAIADLESISLPGGAGDFRASIAWCHYEDGELTRTFPQGHVHSVTIAVARLG
jgi:hypothetical protein